MAAVEQEYVYEPLQGDAIRVLHLLPGNYDHEIRFHLVHQQLNSSIPAVINPGEKREFERSLPRGWGAYKTPEGRWFYCNYAADDGGYTTYEHPNSATISEKAAVRMIDAQPKPTGHSTSRPYEALSYAWGDSERQHTAYVVSQRLGSGFETLFLRLTRNLDIALRYLRHREQVRCIWVDAVSINQEDPDERSSQVARMRHIYSQASGVIAWLGGPSDDSTLALQTMAYLGQQVEISSDGFRFAALHAKEPDWYRGETRLPYSDNTWAMINELFARPFFERLWVLQELFLAGETSVVQCGDCYVSWYDFRRAVVALDEKVGIPAALNLAYQIKGLRTVAYSNSNATIHDVLYLARQHECTDPRDKVYGAYTFLGPGLRDILQPSYSVSTESVFQNILLKYCQVSGRLDMLDKCILQETEACMPSWIPDWRPPSGVSCYPGPGYQTAGLSKACFSTSGNGEILEVLGVEVGALSSVYEPIENEEEETVIARLSEILAESSTSSPYVTGGSIRDAWLTTLVEGRTKDRFKVGYFQSAEEFANTVEVSIRSVRLETELDVGASWSLSTATSNLSLMRFFWTDKGHLGFGHACVRPGDRVCVILGLYVPLILRPKDDSTFQVVGWAYVHGLMDAEALLGPLPKHYKVEQHQILSRSRTRFRDLDTNELHRDDPRLGPLPSEWQFLPSDWIELTPDDPICVEHYQNIETGEMTNHDPRMTPEMLGQRGVRLRTLRLC